MIKKIIKRIFVAIILLPIILLLLGVIYFHIDPFEYEILTDTTVELNAKEDYYNKYWLIWVNIPEKVEIENKEYIVTNIGSSAFSYCYLLKHVKIPATVTVIGEMAFYCCENLTSINIPASVSRIEDHAFLDCKHLSKIDLPASVKYIGEGTFLGCDAITSIDIVLIVVTYFGSTCCRGYRWLSCDIGWDMKFWRDQT